jgi:hypothetical protein
MRRLLQAALVFAATTLTVAASATADVKITDRPYVRHDGGSDATIASCSSDAPGITAGGERAQNEPTATVDPNNPMRMTAGANDYCALPTINDAWAGFYYSMNGGSDWVNSLLPGYPTDTSAEGQASPLFGLAGAAGDPVQAWDSMGHVYYGGIAFNRVKPFNGSIWVARYDWGATEPAPDYEFTTIVSRGTPGFGHFEDKVQLEVDRGVESPHNGNVYMCWARFTGSVSNNFIEFARSTNGGRTWSVQKISANHGSQFCDIAVTRNGTVFVAWRQFAFKPDQGQRQDNAVAWTKSTNGGQTFSRAAVATNFTQWDLTDHFGSPSAAGQAYFDACLHAEYTIGACRSGPEPRQSSRDCGDGPFVCQSGYVFHRADTQVRITADPTAAGDPDAAYLVYDASVPSSLTPTGTTFGTVGSGTGSQASIYFTYTTNGGGSWSDPARIDPQVKGHQFFPDIDADDGELHAFWQDSRDDCSSGPPTTPSGGDFRTVPVANRWVATNPPGAVVCSAAVPGSPSAPGVDAFHASTTTDEAGVPLGWTSTEVSTERTMPQYEQFGNRDIPFFGDYNYIDAMSGTVLMNWTDEREAVPGNDPRYTDGDGTDGFDVHQCRVQSTDGSWSADTCPNAGGLDQNIFGAIID